MHMGMKHEVLTPGVKHRQHSKTRVDLRHTDIEQRLSCGTEQCRVEHLRTIQSNRVEDLRYREDHVEIRNRKKLPLPCLQPCLARCSLTTRTVPVATRTKQAMFSPASLAPCTHRPHLLATASSDRTKRFPLEWCRRTHCQIRVPNRADDVMVSSHAL